MRVLHVVTLVDDRGTYGGALTVAVNQCLELRRRGHDARIAGAWRGRGAPPTELESVPVHLFAVRGTLGALPGGLARPVRSWVREHAASLDVVHLHLGRDLVPLALVDVLRRNDLPFVVQTHGQLPGAGTTSPGASRRVRDRLLAARQVFVHTPDERDTVARVTGTTDHVSMLRNGVVLPEKVPDRPVGGSTDVLFLGRLAPARRVLAFAAAAERLVEDGVDATFSVVGPDGGDLRALRRFIAARPALAGRLRYEGALPHDRAVERLRRADVLVAPSVEEQASPMSLLEALAAGVPAICTTACGLAGSLAREQAAVVANPSDDALYGAMRRLLTDRSARARLSARAAATAASVFSMTPVAEVLEEEYGVRAAAAAPGAEEPRTPLPPRVLWVTDDATSAHVEVWDAMRAGTELTVALLLAGDGLAPELTGRGYPVVRVAAPGDRAPQAVRDMVRGRPDVVVLDGERPATWATVARWARRSGANVVEADRRAGPGAAAARAFVLPGRTARVDLDLRPVRPRPDQDPEPDAVIDLPRDRGRGRHST